MTQGSSLLAIRGLNLTSTSTSTSRRRWPDAYQANIEYSAHQAGDYIAGIYRDKASGARADRPEQLRMIADLQPGEVVAAEKIDRISRLPVGPSC